MLYQGDASLNTDESDSDDYYNYDDADEDVVFQDESERDPEFFDYRLITQEDAENMLDCFVDETAKKLKVRPAFMASNAIQTTDTGIPRLILSVVSIAFLRLPERHSTY